MDELKPTTPKQPFKPKNNDAAMLQQLVTELNAKQPNQKTQAPAPAPMTTEEIAANEIIMQTELAKAAAVENIPVTAQRAAARDTIPVASIPATESSPAPIESPARLFITGHPGAIGGLLDNLPEQTKLVSLSRTVEEVLKATCLLNGAPPAETLLEFRLFGDGQYKPTLTNLLILGIIRHTHPTFGTPGFWANLILQDTTTGEGQLIVVSIRTSVEFKALQDAGFKHFHIMASPQTTQRNSIKGANISLASLAQALDNDTHKKIVQRHGPRLNVVWNDPSKPVSGRFLSVADFKESVLGAEPVLVGSDSVSQIL